MIQSSARLEIGRRDGSKQEFLLNGDVVRIGRAGDNNLVLSESNVSRYHAQLAPQGISGYLLTDLGSSTGTFVNNARLAPSQPRQLKDGDTIRIGGCELRFCGVEEVTTGATATQMTGIGTTVGFEATNFAAPPQAIQTQIVTPILRVTTPAGTQDIPIVKNQMTIGRDPSCDVPINFPQVSSRHAELVERQGSYTIVDLGSRNGLLYQGQRISERRLMDGDAIAIGSGITLTFQTTATDQVPSITHQLNLSNRNNLTIGRDEQNDIAIDHPTVSRYHARISRQDGTFAIADLNSSNGTFVNGKRVSGSQSLRPEDTIRIGPTRFVFNVDETLVSFNEEGNLRLDAVNLTKVVGKGTTLLDDISLSILPREFIVIAGVSGGGKSTLLDALNGFRPATSGMVLVNGEDLYKNFNAYRTELGYVPQDDIIHKELTVKQALDFAAQLRMPSDTTPGERQKRVQEVLTDLELLQRQDVPVKALSGGQRKRVSIGVELITKPSLFFLDEATSGLDPGTELQIMKLLRKLSDQGRTILLITHATKNVTLCDRVVFLAKGGRVAYFGPPAEAIDYFGVEEFDQIYGKVEHELSPEEWQQRFRNSRHYHKYVLERQQQLQMPQMAQRSHRAKQKPGSTIKQVSAWQQFIILSRRNLAILMRDRAGLFLMGAIAPILGLLDFVTWQRNVFDSKDGNAGQAITMLFAAALIAVIVGSLATMREIVKEQEIYRRERMIGLKILPYVMSKVWIGIIIALYQAAIFLLFKWLAVELPGGGTELFNMYVTLFLATLAGMVMGLLVSAISPNQNVAPLLTIIFIVPQITFGGGMLPVDTFGPPGQLINRMTITKWSFESLVTIAGMGSDIADDFYWKLSEKDRKKQTSEQKKKSQCLGARMFKSCEFPGLVAKYDPVVDQKEPQKPADPGKAPSDPRKLDDYEKKVDKYKKDVDSWQKKYSEWKGKYEGAIKSAEGLVERFKQDYGGAFKVSLASHWSMLGIIMAVMFGILFGVQKRKDIV
ncbi:MAG: Vitamin B12 import ATP-binding protein BtuD [Chroococcidiopsis cubana SAG 39.79]|uniref:ABC transporter ATP-binding protein n=1 Tax=Chroococcidiopsis cubana SAG 39.79 TaxID=388085 RepID=A0AB37UEC8_9CYAN|nr:ABC transporter ATP-binding protein/permease [Chroococcidiopsis cubana]MDZ4870631.1 Vitamin B12 import ATP-binding protein BtuD [Chroococcidiopsis cubana SAG 39.79]PSB61112.1 ABC transporter ATP-binding protein [Chroococcidiopsis cubana CCALA 043]RUT06871.1 ABC transporter ATP-binding protein [Chroococcidiopsis cubana SAG 39.79]